MSNKTGNLHELNLRVILIGIALSIIMGSANVYLGLKAGMTVSASIPAAVIGMLTLRYISFFFKPLLAVSSSGGHRSFFHYGKCACYTEYIRQVGPFQKKVSTLDFPLPKKPILEPNKVVGQITFVIVGSVCSFCPRGSTISTTSEFNQMELKVKVSTNLIKV